LAKDKRRSPAVRRTKAVNGHICGDGYLKYVYILKSKNHQGKFYTLHFNFPLSIINFNCQLSIVHLIIHYPLSIE
jgi:hypothetical protein